MSDVKPYYEQIRDAMYDYDMLYNTWDQLMDRLEDIIHEYRIAEHQKDLLEYDRQASLFLGRDM